MSYIFGARGASSVSKGGVDGPYRANKDAMIKLPQVSISFRSQS